MRGGIGGVTFEIMDARPAAHRAERGDAVEAARDRERDAIAVHDLAAARQDRVAARYEQSALTNANEAWVAKALAIAETARDRAQRARARAAGARKRLIAEGIDPNPQGVVVETRGAGRGLPERSGSAQ